MRIKKLHHLNILSTKMEETVRFYVDVLGMTTAKVPTPPGMSEGMVAWICDEAGNAVIHLGGINEKNAAELMGMGYLHRRPAVEPKDFPTLQGGGAVDHIAFECEDYEAFLERIKASGTLVSERNLEWAKFRQIFARDPNGIIIELNFWGK